MSYCLYEKFTLENAKMRNLPKNDRLKILIIILCIRIINCQLHYKRKKFVLNRVKKIYDKNLGNFVTNFLYLEKIRNILRPIWTIFKLI